MKKQSLGNVVIIGDSYSTYEGWIPEGYACYYVPHHRDNLADVLSVEKTWWKRLLDETGSRLLTNNSWSGSTVCNTGYGGADFTHESFITRIRQILPDGKYQGEKVDTLLIFGGTNDNWSNAPVGKVLYGERTQEDLKCFFPAFCDLLEYATTKCHGTRVFCVINNQLRDEVSDGMAEICDHYQVGYVRLHDIEKDFGHPNERGMEQMKDQIAEALFH